MKSGHVNKAWEFYRDDCQGFKEPMRQEFRKLDDYVSGLEDENAKLRELVYDMLEDEERGHNDELTFYEHVERANELGVEFRG